MGEGKGAGMDSRGGGGCSKQRRELLTTGNSAARCGDQHCANAAASLSHTTPCQAGGCATATPPEAAAACAACWHCCSYARRRHCGRGRGHDRCCPAGASQQAAVAGSVVPGWACTHGRQRALGELVRYQHMAMTQACGSQAMLHTASLRSAIATSTACPSSSPARHLRREASAGGRIALLAVAAVLLLVLRRVARPAPPAAPRKAAPARVPIGLLPSMLHVLGVVLMLMLMLRHGQVKHIVRQRCSRVLQGSGRGGPRRGRAGRRAVAARLHVGRVHARRRAHGVPKRHAHARPKHGCGQEAACRAHHRWRRGRRAAPVHSATRAELLLLRVLAEGGGHRPKLHVAADAAKIEGGSGARSLEQLHRLLHQ